jgi:inosine/xanthosine triphosphate pyrophosphatase family protein
MSPDVELLRRRGRVISIDDEVLSVQWLNGFMGYVTREELATDEERHAVAVGDELEETVSRNCRFGRCTMVTMTRKP